MKPRKKWRVINLPQPPPPKPPPKKKRFTWLLFDQLTRINWEDKAMVLGTPAWDAFEKRVKAIDYLGGFLVEVILKDGLTLQGRVTETGQTMRLLNARKEIG